MNKPKMILFDYGQTLIDESEFDGIKGYEAILKLAKSNPYNATAKDLLEFEYDFNTESGRYIPSSLEQYLFEIHDHHFLRLLYEYFHLEFDLSSDELGNIFWDASLSSVSLTKNISSLFKYLTSNNIRIALISNTSYSENSLQQRISKYLPYDLEFILASSEYVVRKPNPLIFQLALRKANLPANQVWFCGDSVFCDIEGANNVGIFPVWYTGAINISKITPPNCNHLKIDDWNNLIGVLQKLN